MWRLSLIAGPTWLFAQPTPTGVPEVPTWGVAGILASLISLFWWVVRHLVQQLTQKDAIIARKDEQLAQSIAAVSESNRQSAESARLHQATLAALEKFVAAMEKGGRP